MVQSVVKEWGGIDILINNAGGGQAVQGPAETLQADDLRRLLDLNVVAVHSVTSSVLQQGMLTNGGRIVNISSRAGKKGLPNISFYVVSKFALEGYTATLAAELADKNVLVNSLSPGMVDTQSFPKAPGKEGVRTAESVRDGLMTILGSGMTGHYLHVDELDQVRAKGLDDAVALKPINEDTFSPKIMAER
jgi:NAD(P)-dependent dehydrogenase (short-subunit alcohol dehydrogenase family)